jgi:hypothetical protein
VYFLDRFATQLEKGLHFLSEKGNQHRLEAAELAGRLAYQLSVSSLSRRSPFADMPEWVAAHSQQPIVRLIHSDI